MKDSQNAKTAAAVLAAAAIGGILAGSATATGADNSVRPGPTMLADKKPADSKSKGEPEGKAAPTKKAKYSHLCTGKNTCKGKGGCKTGDQGCRGKNTCKGKGGCAASEE